MRKIWKTAVDGKKRILYCRETVDFYCGFYFPTFLRPFLRNSKAVGTIRNASTELAVV